MCAKIRLMTEEDDSKTQDTQGTAGGSGDGDRVETTQEDNTIPYIKVDSSGGVEERRVEVESIEPTELE